MTAFTGEFRPRYQRHCAGTTTRHPGDRGAYPRSTLQRHLEAAGGGGDEGGLHRKRITCSHRGAVTLTRFPNSLRIRHGRWWPSLGEHDPDSTCVATSLSASVEVRGRDGVELCRPFRNAISQNSLPVQRDPREPFSRAPTGNRAGALVAGRSSEVHAYPRASVSRESHAAVGPDPEDVTGASKAALRDIAYCPMQRPFIRCPRRMLSAISRCIAALTWLAFQIVASGDLHL